MIGVIDYGAGNLRSVVRALEHLGAESVLLSDGSGFDKVSSVILPGVGSFEASVNELHKRKLFQPTLDWLKADKPFLGICVGMQLLFDEGDESPGVKGLGFFKGSVPRFTEHKVPQIGWNRIQQRTESPLFKDLPKDPFFYFLHSFYVHPEDGATVSASTDYGLEYASVVEQGRVHAVQFHPEKSAANGMTLLKNWIDLYSEPMT